MRKELFLKYADAIPCLLGAGGLVLAFSGIEGLEIMPLPAIAGAALLLFLNRFLFPDKKSSPEKRRPAFLLAGGEAAVFILACFLLRRGIAREWEGLRAALAGTGEGRAYLLSAILALGTAWLFSLFVFLLELPGIPALLAAGSVLLLPYFGIRPGILPLGLLFVSLPLPLLPRRGRWKGAILLAAAGILSVLLILPVSEEAEEGIYRAENAVRTLAGYLRGAPAATAGGGVISRGNVYRTGRAHLSLLSYRAPGEPLYLRGFVGRDYRNGVWSEDDEIEVASLLQERMGWPGWSEFMESMAVRKYYVLNTVVHGPLARERSGQTASPDMLWIEYLAGDGSIRYEPYFSRLQNGDEADGSFLYEYYAPSEMHFRWEEATPELIGAWYYSLEETHKKLIEERYLGFPREELPGLVKLVEENPLSDREEITAFILYTLSSRTSYALNPGRGSAARDPVEDFLFVRQKGFCEHYAAAATLLYRAYGIPARYAVGYLVEPGAFSRTPEGMNKATVTDVEAHAWVEIYLENTGWTPVEVTPAADGGVVASYPGLEPERLQRLMEKEAERDAEKKDREEEAEEGESRQSSFLPVGTEEELEALSVRAELFLAALPPDLAPLLCLYAAVCGAVPLLRRTGRTKEKETGGKTMRKTDDVMKEVGKVILGKEREIREIMTAILAGGHILLEDFPGVGKTMMALAFARAMELDARRIQFTPDVLPSDLTGFSIYRREEDRFVYQPGAVFTNLLLADEINRTSPKTQSALLEVMEEKKVSVEGVTRPVPDPFIVIASENPLGAAGTQPLPEAEIDRFMISLSLGYPDEESEFLLARSVGEARRETLASPVVTAEELRAMRSAIHGVEVGEPLLRYIVELVKATREDPAFLRGASPRATVALVLTAKASAFMDGRREASLKDVQEQFLYVTRHRVELSPEGKRSGKSREELLGAILKRVKEPGTR